ncbi:pentapeptide repeat-containing protein [Archangium lansingense]|uniref:Pentapeptide repeat-containing protein n=1 Tax=Archangium lansingense TaxID=2995310 RepID=A0ABT4ACP4_9BACT|nr:pentapeptide repeat-containing protein [Archangium lansinium]MCY1079448.1 pentapeptide repeat-containing protein [Archangium lansinium]
MLYNKVFFEDREIENERLELTDKGSLYFLGSNMTFKNCTLVLKVSGRNLIFDQGTRFIDCTFEVKQELKNHQQWVFASLKGCRFRGRLSGCDFGYWPSYSERAGHGSIEDCDFSEARLDGCRIMGCDPASLRFPKWPCFTILDPVGRARELNSVQWPGGFHPIIVEGQYRDPPSTMAVTFYAPALAKRRETTEEAFRAVIERFDCIVY